MKKNYLFISLLLLGIAVFGQAPQTFKYQAVARNTNGEPLENHTIGVKISILAGSASGEVVYSEVHEVITNTFGLFDVEIGNGSQVISGNFESIDWGVATHFMKVDMDPTGGSNFQHIGTTQLLSVPYALNARSLTLTSPNGTNYDVSVNDVGNLIISCVPGPTVADAGNDQIDIPGTSTILEGNTPIFGTGLWTIISGTGGNIEVPGNPESIFSGIAGESYELEWSISNPCGTSSDIVSISFIENVIWQCGDPVTDSRDGKTYNTIQIGTQCWMAQNLNVGTMIEGTANPENNATIEKYCFSTTESNCDFYGGLYQWNEMMNYSTTPGVQGICMEGWHLPTDAEFTTMETYVNSQAAYKCNSTSNYIAKSLAAKINWSGSTVTCAVGNDLLTNNATGLAALPGGYRITDGSFNYIGGMNFWWSSSQFDANNAWYRYLHNNNATISRNGWNKALGFSVRCLTDD